MAQRSASKSRAGEFLAVAPHVRGADDVERGVRYDVRPDLHILRGGKHKRCRSDGLGQPGWRARDVSATGPWFVPDALVAVSHDRTCERRYLDLRLYRDYTEQCRLVHRDAGRKGIMDHRSGHDAFNAVPVFSARDRRRRAELAGHNPDGPRPRTRCVASVAQLRPLLRSNPPQTRRWPPSVPIPKFARVCRTLRSELRNRRTLATL